MRGGFSDKMCKIKMRFFFTIFRINSFFYTSFFYNTSITNHNKHTHITSQHTNLPKKNSFLNKKMSQFEEPTSTQTEIRRRMKKWGYPKEYPKEFSYEDTLFYITTYMDEHEKYIGAQESAIEFLQLYDLFIDVDGDKELKKDEVVGYWRLDNNIINKLKKRSKLMGLEQNEGALLIAVKNLYYRLAPGSIKAEDLNNDKVPELNKTSPAAQILLTFFDSVSSENKDGTIRRIDMLAQIHKYFEENLPLTKGQHKKYEILICKLLKFANIDHDGVCPQNTVETKFRT